MKKLLVTFLSVCFIITAIASCANPVDEKPVGSKPTSGSVRLGGLKGPTSMGMVKLLDDNEKGLTRNKYDFTMAVSTDELTPKLAKGDIDIVSVPANLASVLYNNLNGGVRVIGLNTLGVLYVVEKGGEEIKSAGDLKGKTIYATGKGSTPEYALSYLLSENGIDIEKDVTVKWQNEPTAIVSQMKNDAHAVAMLPQPFVTSAASQLDDMRVALDLTEEWEKLGKSLITSVIIARKDFADGNAEAVKKFLDDYKASVDFVNGNTDESSILVEKYGIIKAGIAKKAIPQCHITAIYGEEMKTAVSGYLSILFGQNAKAVGGKLPPDDFYLVYE